MKLPFIDWIWRVKGSLALDPPQSPAEAFGKLDPLLKANGTTYEIDGDTLTYSKDNPAAQDKMATFTRGRLQVVEDASRSRLVYDLTSPALLFCFLAPLLFLAFAQLTISIGELEKAASEARETSETSKEDEDEDEIAPLNPIDIALGAPAPEKPDKEDKDKKDKHSPTAAYVLAALFAALYVVGRILEPWLIKKTFRKTLSGAPATGDVEPFDRAETQHGG